MGNYGDPLEMGQEVRMGAGITMQGTIPRSGFGACPNVGQVLSGTDRYEGVHVSGPDLREASQL